LKYLITINIIKIYLHSLRFYRIFVDMNVNLITSADLEIFKSELLAEIRTLTSKRNESKQWLRTSDVMKMLGLSAGSIQNLRLSQKLPYTKVNGTIFYSLDDVERMLGK